MRKLLLALLILVLSLSLPLSALAQEEELPTIAEIVAGDENLSTLLEVSDVAGLGLGAETDLTVFAPTNDAFEALPPGMLDGLLSSPPSVQAVFSYHVLDGKYTAEDLAAAEAPIPTLLGAPLLFTAGEDGTLTINSTATIVISDIEASNGIVHVIDAVLVPERPGQGGSPAAEGEETGDESAEPTLLDLVTAQEDLAFLTTAVSLSEPIAIALSIPNDGGLTLFAPQDGAFDLLAEDVRDAAIADPLLLASILLYHVVLEPLPSADVLAQLAENEGEIELETALPGAVITITGDEESGVLVNGAAVGEVDLTASNGILHTIDAVLLPADDVLLTQELYDELVNTLRQAAASAGGPAAEAEDETGAPAGEEGPALDPNWAAVAGGFGMAELDTADDFLIEVIDPFATGEDNTLYGVEIINWVADYEYTGFIVQQFLPADVLLWLADQDPTVWETVSDSVLAALPAAELAKLPEEVQARVQ